MGWSRRLKNVALVGWCWTTLCLMLVWLVHMVKAQLIPKCYLKGNRMLYKIRYKFFQIISSIIASISYRIDSFLDHYHGPDYKFLIQDYDEFLRSKLEYTEELGSFGKARDELWAKLNERGLTIWD